VQAANSNPSKVGKIDKVRRLVILFILTLTGLPAQSPFLQKPYLQLGNAAYLGREESIAVLWHTPDSDEDWRVEFRQGDGQWRGEPGYVLRRINVRGLTPHRVYQAVLTGLIPGREFDYRLNVGGQTVFTSKGRARRAAGDPQKFAVYGDMSQDSEGQKALAWQIHQAQPDYLLSVGDIVYSRGLASEYYRKYFPIYNCDQGAPGKCGSILRSILTMAVLGNHDAPNRVDFGSLPDALAYYYYWSQPLNGPLVDKNSGHTPELRGSQEQLREFSRSAPNFPRMGMFSFDYGDVHWLMLDSDSYVDWHDPQLREWVRKDLRAASKSAWRIVAMHHPAFQSAHHHFDDQWMRQMVHIFQEENVAVVFSGHVHNYQRTYPLKFTIDPADKDKTKKGKIKGQFQLDKEFDGSGKTKPNGIIHIVTGAGGGDLYDKKQETDKDSWQEYTTAFAASVHSFTSVEATPASLSFRQISQDGKELDRFVIKR